MTKASFWFFELLHNLTKPSSQFRPDMLNLCHVVPRKKKKVISDCVYVDRRLDCITLGLKESTEPENIQKLNYYRLNCIRINHLT